MAKILDPRFKYVSAADTAKQGYLHARFTALAGPNWMKKPGKALSSPVAPLSGPGGVQIPPRT